MIKNYFILSRLVFELNKELNGYKIVRIFSFEKDKIVAVLSDDKDELSLEVSVNPGFSYLILKRKFSVPKKNLADFFTSYLPMEIQSIGIAENDRIIRILTDKASLYFAVRGKFTNVYLVSNEKTESFKKTDEKVLESFRLEISEQRFFSEFNMLKLDNEYYDTDLIRKKYPVIGKEIINEAVLREGKRDRISKNSLITILNEITSNKPVIFVDESNGDVNLGVETFGIFSFTRKEIFSNINDAIKHYLIEKSSRENTTDKRKIIEKHLDRELRKISSKLNDIDGQIQKGSKEKEYNSIANLLLININKISKRIDNIDLQDIYDENITVKIKLDPKLSPKQNVDFYFQKSRNEKIIYDKMNKLSSDLRKKFSDLQRIKHAFINAETSEELDSLMKELNIRQDTKKRSGEDLKNKFRHYVIQNRYDVYVGKDSKSNDLLTMKFAKQNDYWFHARSVSGSHVVLKNNKPKEGIPKNILKIAASIAAYFSKAKTAGMVPVSFTQKKYVSKKKGMEPGKVVLLREEVLIVKPEIPTSIKFIEN